MEKIEVGLYQFEELNENARKTAIKWYRDTKDYPFLSEDLQNELEYQLNELKIEFYDLKVYYGLGYCQGDYFLFEGTLTYGKYTYKLHVNSGLYHNVKIIQMDEYGEELETKESLIAYSKFTTLYEDLCRQMKRYGYKEIEYMDSDESIIESIKCNEYTFLANGKRANKEDFS